MEGRVSVRELCTCGDDVTIIEVNGVLLHMVGTCLHNCTQLLHYCVIIVEASCPRATSFEAP
jgi:hypothetical protein